MNDDNCVSLVIFFSQAPAFDTSTACIYILAEQNYDEIK